MFLDSSAVEETCVQRVHRVGCASIYQQKGYANQGRTRNHHYHPLRKHSWRHKRQLASIVTRHSEHRRASEYTKSIIFPTRTNQIQIRPKSATNQTAAFIYAPSLRPRSSSPRADRSTHRKCRGTWRWCRLPACSDRARRAKKPVVRRGVHGTRQIAFKWRSYLE